MYSICHSNGLKYNHRVEQVHSNLYLSTGGAELIPPLKTWRKPETLKLTLHWASHKPHEACKCSFTRMYLPAYIYKVKGLVDNENRPNKRKTFFTMSFTDFCRSL